MKKIIAAILVFAVAFGLTWIIDFFIVAQVIRTIILLVLIGCIFYYGYFVVKAIGDNNKSNKR